MCPPRTSGPAVSRLGLVVFEEEDFRGEGESIIWSVSPLPCLTASCQGHNEGSAQREEGQIRRTQSTKDTSGPVGRRRVSGKLTAAHSGSRTLRIAEDDAVAVHYLPRTFAELQELEDAV